jgi:hypothetical protein
MQAVDVHFLVDNQLLVNFISGPDSSNPLDWRITPYTSTDKKFLAGSNSTQPQNSTPTKMADLLAKQSFYMIQATWLDSPGLRVNPSHSHKCPSLMAFHNLLLSM